MDQITLPMAGLNAVLNLHGALAHHPHRHESSPSMLPTDASSATALARWPGHVPGGVVDRLVDRLRAQTAPPLPRKPGGELVRDLLRAPALPEKLPDRGTQHRVNDHPPLPGTAGPLPGHARRVVTAILALRVGVAANLPADCRGGATELVGDRTDRPACRQAIGDQNALVLAEVPRCEASPA
jgi:hypothetical protein